MNNTVKQDLYFQEYLQYKFVDLEIEQNTQESKAFNASLSPAVRTDANIRLEAIELALQVFMKAAEAGHDVTVMTLEQSLCLVSGKTPQQLYTVGLSSAYHKFDYALGRSVDTASEKLKTGLNKFGSWLADRTAPKK